MKPQISVVSSDNIPFKPAPIPADWIVSGNPVARNHVLFTSADKLQFTLFWHCTAGSFRWYYDEDETIQLLEGAMTLVFDNGSTRYCQPGDIVYFQAGTTCVWIIEHEVKKLAFFREPAPGPFAIPIRIMRKLVDRSGLRRLTRSLYLRKVRATQTTVRA
jgi:hypothetical protein